jgi:hypothetical protein
MATGAAKLFPTARFGQMRPVIEWNAVKFDAARQQPGIVTPQATFIGNFGG